MEPSNEGVVPERGGTLSYGDFLNLLSGFSNAGWEVTSLGTIRTVRSSKSPFSIICEEMISLDIAGNDYRGAEALGLSRRDARRIIRALNGSDGFDAEVRKDLLRAVDLLGYNSKKTGE